MIDRDVLVDSSVVSGILVGDRVDAADAPVGVGRAEGGRDVAESSLAVCIGSVWQRPPKNVVKASLTREVVGRSLSVNGYRSKTSNSASLGDPEAWHSAVTIRRMASSIVVRVCLL